MSEVYGDSSKEKDSIAASRQLKILRDLWGGCERQFDDSLLLNSTLSAIPHKHPGVSHSIPKSRVLHTFQNINSNPWGKKSSYVLKKKRGCIFSFPKVLSASWMQHSAQPPAPKTGSIFLRGARRVAPQASQFVLLLAPTSRRKYKQICLHFIHANTKTFSQLHFPVTKAFALIPVKLGRIPQ